jgi:HAD superfamily hydrolase (TIGR01509 family)
MAPINLPMGCDYPLQFAPYDMRSNETPPPAQDRWQLAIFDCDGVLVDSETIAHRALVEALSELGLALTLKEAFTLFRGNTTARSVAIIEERLGRRLAEDFFPVWRERLYERFRQAPVQPIDGVVEALDSLPMPTCVVSNGTLRKMQTTLGVTGLLPRFEGRLFSADMGIAGKPAPDLFLAAAKALDAVPARTVVIEDSRSGVDGAIAAGMTVLGYAGEDYTDARELEAAGAHVFRDMRELPHLLARGTRSVGAALAATPRKRRD